MYNKQLLIGYRSLLNKIGKFLGSSPQELKFLKIECLCLGQGLIDKTSLSS